MMKRLLIPGLLALVMGCSNAPLTGTMDCIFPSKVRPAPVVTDPGRPSDTDPIRPNDRSGLPPIGGYPHDDPRRNNPAAPTRRNDPAPATDDPNKALPPPVGLDDPLPPPRQ